MLTHEIIKNRVLAGEEIGKAEALELCAAPLEELCAAADVIRWKFCGSAFDLCSIINAKSGRCPENCKFCAQSAHYHTNAEEYPLLPAAEMVALAKHNAENGILRFSLVTSGERLTDAEVNEVCERVCEIRKNAEISVCVSLGLLSEDQFHRLRQAGVERVHNNLETSRRFFPQVCTTHKYDDKIAVLKAAQNAGLSVCSGGIIGLGETMEDRIDMALEVRSLGVRSVPLNVLNPIPGTPFEHNEKLPYDEIRRTAAIFRFLLPNASIRLAGGRGLMSDKGKACFQSGANAAISGDMLTTTGVTIEEDMKIVKKLGYEPRLWNA